MKEKIAELTSLTIFRGFLPMNSDSFERSQKIRILAGRFRHHKSDPNFDIPNDKTTNSRIQDQVQNSEPIKHTNAVPCERIKPNRAVVLIRLFVGEKGDLIHLILIKCSYKPLFPVSILINFLMDIFFFLVGSPFPNL